MDIAAWMREQLDTGAFAHHEPVSAAELARAARTALGLPKEQARACRSIALAVLAEPRPPGRCRACEEPLDGPRGQLCAGCRILAWDAAQPVPVLTADGPLCEMYAWLLRRGCNVERRKRGLPALPQ